jgi:diguanylate cyclase (GGDEF) domain
MIPRAKFGNILVFNSDGYLTPKASVGFNRDEADIKLKLEESVLNTATGGKLDGTVIANTMDDILNKKNDVSPASPAPGIRSEASTPLYIDGDVVGLLCINSAEKDIFSERDIYILEYASNLISIVLKDQKTSGENLYLTRYDVLTRLPSRASFDRELIRLLNDPSKDAVNLYFILIDLNELKLINEKLGHRTGDEILQKFSDILRRHLGKNDFCGRYGGDEFVAVIQGDSVFVNHILDEIAKELGENKKIINNINFTPSFRHGKASFKEGKSSMDMLYALADRRMNESRRERNRRFLEEED